MTRFLRATALLVLLAGFASSRSTAETVKPATLDAWDQYIQNVNTRLDKSTAEDAPFLLCDSDPALRKRVLDGEIVVFRVGGDGAIKVHSGLIHDWMATVFIPKASADDVMAILRDYEHYPDYFHPQVVSARLRSEDSDGWSYSAVMRQKVLWVTAVYQIDQKVRWVQLDSTRSYTLSEGGSVQEIDNFEQGNQFIQSPGQGHGYVWRLATIQKLEERDGGVYIETETIALSRDIPFIFRWIVQPVVEHFPRNALLTTLQQTRQAVIARLETKPQPEPK
jgi:hypothetical protein